LAATLRSPLFQVTDDTLYWLSQAAKAEDENYSLYRGVLDFETITQLTEEERGKLRFYKETAAELRREKDKLRLTELLDLILERTGYELALAAGADSVRRLANLKKLLSMARREEVNGPVTASDFLKRVKRLELQEVRESEAQIESEASGRVVRLMTIHKSKGLEFKVVFVSDMGRASRNSSTGKIMAKTGIGAGLQVWNELGRKWEEPALWKRLKEEQARKEKEERKRLLYVAMTRAREKLFLCGIVDNEKNIADKSFYELASWMDWLNLSESETGTLDRLAPVLTDRGEDGGIIADWEQVWQRVSGKEGLDAEASSNELIVRERLKPRPLVRSRAVDLPVSAFALFKASSEAYGRVYEAGVPEAWEDSPARQEMAQDVQADAADFGTAMHALFERLNFKNPKDRVEELLEDCFGGLPPACRPEAENLLNLFTQTELFKRLQRAQRIERELPFVLRERHGMIQGVIDVLFEDDQGWHVLDYKTALGDESKVISRGYQYQIEIYAAACRQLMGKSPQSGILYFLKNQWQYVVSFNKEALDRAALDLRQTQEDILDYKNQLYSK